MEGWKAYSREGQIPRRPVLSDSSSAFKTITCTICVRLQTILYCNSSGRLPIRQSRQLPKARHGAEGCNQCEKMLSAKFGFFRHCFRVCEKKSEKSEKRRAILSSVPSILARLCFVFMLDVLVFVKQHKLVQYIVLIESIFFILYNS